MTHATYTPTAEQVAAAPLFRTLTPAQCDVLAAQLEVEQFEAGRTLMREGAYGYSFSLLRSGTVDVQHEGRVIGTLGADDFFGEMAILGDGHRNATLVATAPGTLWCMFGTTFRKLELDHPEIAEIINAAAARRSDV